MREINLQNITFGPGVRDNLQDQQIKQLQQNSIASLRLYKKDETSPIYYLCLVNSFGETIGNTVQFDVSDNDVYLSKAEFDAQTELLVLTLNNDTTIECDLSELINTATFEEALANKSNATNLENGEGQDSLVQKYTGNVDDLHFPNTNTGGSATVLGEANSNTANRALITGKLNRNTAPNSIIAGLGNGRGFASEPELSPLTGDNLIVGGKRNSNENANNVFLSGEDNKNYGNNVIMAGSHNINNHNNVIMTGLYNKNTAGSPNAIIGGTYCEPVENAHLIIGCGTNDNTRRNSITVIGDTVSVEKFVANDTVSLGYSTYIRRALVGNAPKVSDASLLVVGMGTTFNAFEVHADGHAEVQTQGTSDKSVVIKSELDAKVTNNIASNSEIDTILSSITF